MKFVETYVAGDLCARLIPGTEYLFTELEFAFWTINGELAPEGFDQYGFYTGNYFTGGKYIGPDADGVEPVFTLHSAQTEQVVHAMVRMLEGHGDTFAGNIPTDTAHDWLDHDFTVHMAAEWCQIGVWDPATAAEFANADLTPDVVAENAARFVDCDAIYACCNGDLDTQKIIDAARDLPPIKMRSATRNSDGWALWESCTSQILYPVDEIGVNFSNARVRHLLGDQWLYVDDTDGFEVVSDEVVESWTLLAEDPRLGYDAAGNVIRL